MSVRSSVQLPTIELPEFELPTLDTTKVVEAARDFAYLTVGVGAAAAEKAEAVRKDFVAQATSAREERRQQFDKVVADIKAQLEDARDQLQLSFAEAQDRYDAAVVKVDAAIESLSEKLPEPAQKVAVQLHDAAKSARQQVSDRLAPAA